MGISLKARHFALEFDSDLQQLPPYLEPGARRIFHRTFRLSLDVAEPIALFCTSQRHLFVMARDSERALPVRIPVFFIGSDGQPAATLKEDAERAAFANSSSLTDADDFAAVRFHLRRGGWSFTEIQPFFTCGLPGLMLCEDRCPSDVVPLAQTLIDWVLQGKPWELQTEPPPANNEVRPGGQTPAPQTPAPQTAGPRAPAQAPQTVSPAPPAAAPQPSVAAVPSPVPQAPRQQNCPPAPSCPAAVQPPKAEPPPADIAEPASPKQETPPSPETPSKQETPAPAVQPSPAPPSSHQLLFAFAGKSGAALDAREVFQAEGNIAIMGAVASPVAGGMTVSVPEDAVAEATKPETIEKAIRHYHVLDVRAEEGRTVVEMEPRFVRASDLTIKISSRGNENVSGCVLSLDVFKERQLGPGWSKANIQNLRFKEVGPFYALVLSGGVDKSELLIDTAKDGDAARLYSTTTSCKLDSGPGVTAGEISSGSISRALRESAGQVLMALVSTDSEFYNQVSTGAADGFWASALSLVSSVSEGAWEQKVLGRAQAPGASPETRKLEILRSGKLAAGPSRDWALKKLIEGSHLEPDGMPFASSKPIARYGLDEALRIVRDDAKLAVQDEAPRELLLLITGGIDPAGGHFCRNPASGDSVSPAQGVRKMFVLEVWSPAFAASLERILRAKPAEGAPPGIYSCNFPRGDGGNIVLMGVLPSALGDSARTATFAYLTAQANSYLRP